MRINDFLTFFFFFGWEKCEFVAYMWKKGGMWGKHWICHPPGIPVTNTMTAFKLPPPGRTPKNLGEGSQRCVWVTPQSTRYHIYIYIANIHTFFWYICNIPGSGSPLTPPSDYHGHDHKPIPHLQKKLWRKEFLLIRETMYIPPHSLTGNPPPFKQKIQFEKLKNTFFSWKSTMFTQFHVMLTRLDSSILWVMWSFAKWKVEERWCFHLSFLPIGQPWTLLGDPLEPCEVPNREPWKKAVNTPSIK